MFLGYTFVVAGLIGLASAGFELTLKPSSYGDHNIDCRNNDQMDFGLLAGAALMLLGLGTLDASGHLQWLEVAFRPLVAQ